MLTIHEKATNDVVEDDCHKPTSERELNNYICELSDPLFFKEQSELADADCWCLVNQSEGDLVIGSVLVFGQSQERGFTSPPQSVSTSNMCGHSALSASVFIAESDSLLEVKIGSISCLKWVASRIRYGLRS